MRAETLCRNQKCNEQKPIRGCQDAMVRNLRLLIQRWRENLHQRVRMRRRRPVETTRHERTTSVQHSMLQADPGFACVAAGGDHHAITARTTDRTRPCRRATSRGSRLQARPSGPISRRPCGDAGASYRSVSKLDPGFIKFLSRFQSGRSSWGFSASCMLCFKASPPKR